MCFELRSADGEGISKVEFHEVSAQQMPETAKQSVGMYSEPADAAENINAGGKTSEL